ncbi:hypothetical protein BDD12DRAFT_803142 [Trichophaea hybrida]|nr:hypothetical protein BDD12DRAFT_803142 [Trichophaea hybrida]
MACQVIGDTYSAAGEELTSQKVVGPEQDDGFVGYKAEGGQKERYVTVRCAAGNTRSGEMTDVCQVAERLGVCRLKALFGNKYWQGKREVDTPGCGECVADKVGRRLPTRHSGEGLQDDSQGLLRPSEWSGELDMQVVAYCWSIPSLSLHLFEARNASCVGGWDIWVYNARMWSAGQKWRGPFRFLQLQSFQCSAAEMKRVQTQSERVMRSKSDERKRQRGVGDDGPSFLLLSCWPSTCGRELKVFAAAAAGAALGWVRMRTASEEGSERERQDEFEVEGGKPA